jgi:hypothetical protein
MESAENFLEHFGVKGMHWGQRRETIIEARSQQAKLTRKTNKAKTAYDRANATGTGRAAALRELKKNEKIEWENRQTAKTLTRGEQVFTGVLAGVVLTPLTAVALLGGSAVYSRDKKKFHSKYPNS